MLELTDEELEKYFPAVDIIDHEMKRVSVCCSGSEPEVKYISQRIIPCTSRGGTMVLENIKKTGSENFYYTYFDEILDIAKVYNVAISLGAIFRPANIYDAKFKEIATQCCMDNADSYKKLFTDTEFYQKVMEAMAKELYKALRKD